MSITNAETWKWLRHLARWIPSGMCDLNTSGRRAWIAMYNSTNHVLGVFSTEEAAKEGARRVGRECVIYPMNIDQIGLPVKPVLSDTEGTSIIQCLYPATFVRQGD